MTVVGTTKWATKENQHFLARRMREEREKKRLSRQNLANTINAKFGTNVHHQTIVKLENNTRGISDDWLHRYAEALGIDIHLLLTDPNGAGESAGNAVPPREPSPAGKIPAGSDPAGRSAHPNGSTVPAGATAVPVINGDAAPQCALFISGRSETLAAALLPDGHRDASKSYFVFDKADCEPVPRSYYVIREEGGLACRRYRTNPERWEPFSPCAAADHVLYPARPVEVLGKLVEVVLTF